MKRLDVEETYTSSIIVGPRLRSPNADAVDRMAASLSTLGLLVPIGVKIVDEMEIDGTVCCGVPVLIYGATRLAAAKKLGWEKIDTQIIDGDEIDARLAEIAENLHRSELSVQERSDHIAEWIRLTEQRISSRAGTKSGAGAPERGVRAAARELGITRMTAHRAVKIASISDDARKEAAESGVGLVKDLIEVAAQPTPDAQVSKVRDIAQRRNERNAAEMRDQKSDAAEKIAEMIAEHIPGEHWDGIKANLYATTSKEIAQALQRLIGVSVFDRTRAGAA